MNNTLDSNQTTGIPDIPESMIFDIRTMIKWGKFLSIVSFVMCGIILLAAVFILASGQNSMGYSGGNTFVLAFVYLLMTAFYFIPSLYLFNFTKYAQSAINLGNKEDTAKAIEKLAFVFKFLGISMLIGIAIWVIVFLLGMSAALSI